jgi:molybdopterin molybdotransferase
MVPESLLSVDEARARVLSQVAPLPSEDRLIREALGRVLVEGVVARRTLPPWDNSAMDGFALRSADASAPGAKLRVVGAAFAGRAFSGEVNPGECARIMTGAPLPRGTDCVAMRERVRVQTVNGEELAELAEATPAGHHVRSAGEDARAGEPLLPSGALLGIPEASLLWAQGLTTVKVHRAPRVAVFSTGDELCPIGEVTGDRIVDTNSPAVAALARRAGAEVTELGIAGDSLEAVIEQLAAARDFDVVLTTAGVSVGDRDFVRPALEACGVSLSFWRVAIKPGKPLVVGTRAGTLFMGLPGNPISSLVTFELFVRPALLRLQGRQDVEPLPLKAKLDGELRKQAGLTHFVRVRVEPQGEQLWARPLASQTSGALQSARSATHLLVFPADMTELSRGEDVRLWPVSWGA